MRKYILILSIIFLMLSCEKTPLENSTVADENSTITQEDNEVTEDNLMTEDKEKTELDERKWHFMKDLANGVDEYYKSNLKYPENIKEFSPYLYNEEEFTQEEMTKFFNYTVKANSLGKEDACYNIAVSFESEHYITHNDENGVFVVGNYTTPTCK